MKKHEVTESGFVVVERDDVEIRAAFREGRSIEPAYSELVEKRELRFAVPLKKPKPGRRIFHFA